MKVGKLVSLVLTVQNLNTPLPAVLGLAADVVTLPMPPIAQGPSHLLPASTVSSKLVIVEVVSDWEEHQIKGKGKEKVEATAGLIPKNTKCWKVLPQFVPVHHLNDEEPAPPSK
jgi:hypothetical protein